MKHPTALTTRCRACSFPLDSNVTYTFDDEFCFECAQEILKTISLDDNEYDMYDIYNNFKFE